MIFDTHAHYDAEQFDADRDALLRSLPEKGVSLVLDPGCDGESSAKCAALAACYPHVYAAVGWHPEEWAGWTEHSPEQLRALARLDKVVAIGEIGLDYHWDTGHKALQREMLETQLAMALELDLPVIIHDRDAHEDCLNIVSCFPGLRGVFHCYSGSAEMAEILLRDGWYLGFDGPVTYKSNRKAAAVLAVTPPERILVETDSPYMAPEPCRGRRNDSTLLPYIIGRIAEFKGMDARELEEQTRRNGEALFGIA